MRATGKKDARDGLGMKGIGASVATTGDGKEGIGKKHLDQ
jgi:hypothetical protein